MIPGMIKIRKMIPLRWFIIFLLLQYQRTKSVIILILPGYKNKKNNSKNINKFLSLYVMMIRLLHKISLIFIFIPGILCSQPAKDNYSSSSVLSSGQWFKLSVLKDGIYRIDYSQLRQAGVLDPANPRIFANNLGQLSYYTSDPSPDDLKELSVSLVSVKRIIL